jgi:serine/threonine-protein kinase
VQIKSGFLGWSALNRSTTAPEPASPSPPVLQDSDDPLRAFGTEQLGDHERPAYPRSRLYMWAGAVALILVSATLGALLTMRKAWPIGSGAAASASLQFDTQPSGAEVLIDGQPQGVAPLTLAVPSGAHSVTVKLSEEPAAAAGARITVTSEPPGLRVQVDGVALGVTPLIVPATAPATHRVAVVGDTGSAERSLVLEKGANASIVFALPKTAPASEGWVAVTAPFEVHVRDNGDLIATGRSMKLTLAARAHVLSLTSDLYQFQQTRRVDVVAGRTVPLEVEPPRATLSVNARPWADVLIDGVPVGQTPISNLSVTVGPHDVLFRHPQLGDRPQPVAVTVRGPNRIAVDLTR